jgi:hypothetical protein
METRPDTSNCEYVSAGHKEHKEIKTELLHIKHREPGERSKRINDLKGKSS